jgi:hypothetical protein
MGKSVPVINQWYQDIAVNRLFEVIAVDEYSALIDIRYVEPSGKYSDYSGISDEARGLDEISFEDWAQLVVVTAPAPDNWRSSLSSVENELISAARKEAADYLFGWDEF